MNKSQEFEKMKEELLQEARKVGIVDVSTGSTDGVTPRTLTLAIDLTKEYKENIYRRLEERRNSQK
jgi:hypothetical protein